MKRSRIVLLIIFVGCVFSSLLFLQNLNPKEIDPSDMQATSPPREESTKQASEQYGVPIRLKIPKLKIDAAVEQLSVTPEGDMQAPSEPQSIGWYKFGAHPGNKGSAVIAGHYGLNSNDDASVFNKLHTLSKGDTVQVIDEKDAVATFVVHELKTYDKDAVVPEVFSSNDKEAHLNLITCKGTWQEAQQTYLDRLVVFTTSQT